MSSILKTWKKQGIWENRNMANTQTKKTQEAERLQEGNRTRDRATLIAERRQLRGDLGYRPDVLTYKERPGYVRRVVNDVGDRIERLKGLGWEVVDEPGIRIGDQRAIDSNKNPEGSPYFPVGENMMAVLMEIPKEIWDADREVKREAVNRIEREIRNQHKKEGYDGYHRSEYN